MARYRAIFDGNGLLAEFEGDDCTFVRPDYVGNDRKSQLSAPMVIRDIEPYRNMIDGTMITSRSQHRNLLKDHGCVEVGNETMKPTKPAMKNTRRENLHRLLADDSDKQCDKLLKTLKKELRP